MQRTLSHKLGLPLLGLAAASLAFILGLASAPAAFAQLSCIAANNGTGTATLPPAGCSYQSPSQVHLILNGLPPGTTIQLNASHDRFLCRGVPGPCVFTTPGGGQIEQFDSTVNLTLTGTGLLAGFSRTISIPAAVETETGPRTLGASVQTFSNRMNSLQGSLSGSDPDFAMLKIVAGRNFGLNSPGQTTLTQLSNGNYRVQSYFDVAYSIEFKGTDTGALAGYGGETTGTVRMSVGK